MKEAGDLIKINKLLLDMLSLLGDNIQSDVGVFTFENAYNMELMDVNMNGLVNTKGICSMP